MRRKSICTVCLVLVVSTLLLLTSTPVRAEGWTVETVYSQGDVGQHTSIAIDALDNIHISFYDHTNGDLLYIWGRNRVVPVRLDVQPVKVDSANDVGSFSSLAVDSLGHPHISYYDSTHGDLKYARNTTGTWHIETVDSVGDVGLYSSIALNSSGYARIVYYDNSTHTLKWSRDNGALAGWTTLTLDSTGDAGQYASIVIDSHDISHISYYDSAHHELKYVQVNETGAPSLPNVIDSGGNVGEYSKIRTTTRDAFGNVTVLIVYYDATNGDLKMAVKTGDSWTIKTVDSEGDVGRHASLVLTGSPTNPGLHIAYYDSTHGHLKYAAGTPDSLTMDTVPATGDVGGFTSITLDSSMNPHIAFYDFTNGDLEYATQASALPTLTLPSAILTTLVLTGTIWMARRRHRTPEMITLPSYLL